MTPLEQKVLLLLFTVVLVGWTTRAWVLSSRHAPNESAAAPEGKIKNRIGAP